MAVTWKKLAYVDDVLSNSIYDANTIIKADTDNTPVALAIAEQTLVGRITAGVIAALTATQVRTLLNVADGADVTGDNPPQAHAASHKNGGSDEILLNELGEPTAAVAINGQQITDPVLHTVADATARGLLTPLVGKICWQTDELAIYACTVAV